MFSSGGVTPRGFKHFATSPTHPHARNCALSGGGKREKSAALKKFSGYR
jgi:hypothetical protein